MANDSTPFGLRPVKHLLGVEFSGATNPYHIVGDVATAMFSGDPVLILATGSNSAIVSTGVRQHGIGELPDIGLASAGDGNLISGVIVGFEPVASLHRDKVYNPASTEAVALVCDDPFVVFDVRANAAGTALTYTAINLNAVLSAGSGGSTFSGNSSWALDTSDVPAADASNQVRILRKSNIKGNAMGANVVLEVIINNHTQHPGALGI